MWNSIPDGEKLSLWKKLREDIKLKSINDQLADIAKFCANIPFGSRTIDYYSPETWPTPWEILYHNSFCTNSISLLMFYTLMLIRVPHKIQLCLVEDNDGMYLIPIIDDQFVLNYELGQVSNYQEVSNEFKIIQVFTEQHIKKIA